MMTSQISEHSFPRIVRAGVHRVSQNKTSIQKQIAPVEEILIVDERGATRPAQMVEHKLSEMLQGSCLAVSQLRLKNLLVQRASA